MAKPEWHTIIYNIYLYMMILLWFFFVTYVSACFGLKHQEGDHNPGNILRVLIDAILKFKLHIKKTEVTDDF